MPAWVEAATLSFKVGDVVWVKRTVKPKDPMQQKRFDTLYRIKKLDGSKTIADVYERMLYGTLLIDEDASVTTSDISDDTLFEVSPLTLMPAPAQTGFIPSEKSVILVDANSSSTSLSGNVNSNAVIPNKLQVLGDIQVGTETSGGCLQSYDGSPLAGTCLSDERLKEDVQPFETILDKLVKLTPVTYYFRSEEFPEFSFGPNKQYGLIAQQVEPLLPELVADNVKMGYKGVNYHLLPIYLLEGVKELSERVDALRIASGEVLQGSTIRSLQAKELTIDEGALLKGTLTVEDHVGFGIDTVGQAKITPGARDVAVKFTKSYDRAPVVVAAPVDFTGSWKMRPATIDGFAIELTTTSTADVLFNWYAFEGSEKMTITVSEVPSTDAPLSVQPPVTNDAAPVVPSTTTPTASSTVDVPSSTEPVPSTTPPTDPEPSADPTPSPETSTPVVEPTPVTDPTPPADPESSAPASEPVQPPAEGTSSPAPTESTP